MVDNRKDIQSLLEECQSDDPVERFEAFDILWDRALNQGTPCSETVDIFEVLLKWIEERHPDWPEILESAHCCALDLSFNPGRRSAKHDAMRAEALATLLRAHATFEAILDGPCSLDTGECPLHYAAAGLLRLAIPHRRAWLAAQAIALIRRDGEEHAKLWEILWQPVALDALTDGELQFCVEQKEDAAVRRHALFQLSARGDQRSADRLAKVLGNSDPLWEPTVGEVSLVVRAPGNIPMELLTLLFSRAHELRVLHDLAAGMLRKFSGDRREGWDTVLERRPGGTLFIRHPGVEAVSRPEATPELIGLRNSLLCKRDLLLVDTDLWALFGLAAPANDWNGE